MVSDEQIRDMLRALESIVWAVRPDRIRQLPMVEQQAWKNRIMLEIHTGERIPPRGTSAVKVGGQLMHTCSIGVPDPLSPLATDSEHCGPCALARGQADGS